MSDVDFGVMLPVMVPSGPRPLPFYHALQYRYGGLDVGVVREAALEAERLEYHSVWVSDHLSREVCRERLECWTTMTWLATLTERIRLGSMVICNLYRHPGLMAKMASTLDLVSGGRLELGQDKPRSQRGRPTFVDEEEGAEIVGIMKKLSEPSGTEIGIDGGIGTVEL